MNEVGTNKRRIPITPLAESLPKLPALADYEILQKALVVAARQQHSYNCFHEKWLGEACQKYILDLVEEYKFIAEKDYLNHDEWWRRKIGTKDWTPADYAPKYLGKPCQCGCEIRGRKEDG